MKKQNSWPLYPSLCCFASSILAFISGARWQAYGDSGISYLTSFVALLAGIFSIMDMGITTVNCIGSVVVAAVVSASEERRAQKNDTPKA